eukprot:16349530-Heterocapsa_arctica.AAC.1
MLRLRHRICEATKEASDRDEVRKEYRLYVLLDRITKVMEAGQSSQTPFHGIAEGFDTENIIATSNRRAK